MKLVTRNVKRMWQKENKSIKHKRIKKEETFRDYCKNELLT